LEWINQIILATIGFSAGAIVAGGIFAFIIGLGVISDFADRTHTGEYILLYEDAVALGGILGNFLFIYPVEIPFANYLIPIFGLFSGIFTGAWAMALAEMLNIFPIFVRRTKLATGMAWVILGMAIGRGTGEIVFFINGWGI